MGSFSKNAERPSGAPSDVSQKSYRSKISEKLPTSEINNGQISQTLTGPLRMHWISNCLYGDSGQTIWRSPKGLLAVFRQDIDPLGEIDGECIDLISSKGKRVGRLADDFRGFIGEEHYLSANGKAVPLSYELEDGNVVSMVSGHAKKITGIDKPQGTASSVANTAAFLDQDGGTYHAHLGNSISSAFPVGRPVGGRYDLNVCSCEGGSTICSVTSSGTVSWVSLGKGGSWDRGSKEFALFRDAVHVAGSPNNSTVFVVTEKGTLYSLGLKNLQITQFPSITFRTGYRSAVAMAASSTLLAVGTGDGKLLTYDLFNPKNVHHLNLGYSVFQIGASSAAGTATAEGRDPRCVFCLLFSEDGKKVVATTNKGELVFFDVLASSISPLENSSFTKIH